MLSRLRKDRSKPRVHPRGRRTNPKKNTHTTQNTRFVEATDRRPGKFSVCMCMCKGVGVGDDGVCECECERERERRGWRSGGHLPWYPTETVRCLLTSHTGPLQDWRLFTHMQPNRESNTHKNKQSIPKPAQHNEQTKQPPTPTHPSPSSNDMPERARQISSHHCWHSFLYWGCKHKKSTAGRSLSHRRTFHFQAPLLWAWPARVKAFARPRTWHNGLKNQSINQEPRFLYIVCLGLSYGFSVFLKRCRTICWNQSMPFICGACTGTRSSRGRRTQSFIHFYFWSNPRRTRTRFYTEHKGFFSDQKNKGAPCTPSNTQLRLVCTARNFQLLASRGSISLVI